MKVEERWSMLKTEDVKTKQNSELEMKNAMSEMYIHWIGVTCRSYGAKEKMSKFENITKLSEIMNREKRLK